MLSTLSTEKNKKPAAFFLRKCSEAFWYKYSWLPSHGIWIRPFSFASPVFTGFAKTEYAKTQHLCYIYHIYHFLNIIVLLTVFVNSFSHIFPVTVPFKTRKLKSAAIIIFVRARIPGYDKKRASAVAEALVK